MPLQCCKGCRFGDGALQEFLDADGRDNERAPAQRRQELARWSNLARGSLAFEID
jgi:hypothetical protein